MKHSRMYIGAILVAGAALAYAGTVRTPFAEMEGPGIRPDGDRGGVLHEPEDPTEILIKPWPGWHFKNPQDATVTHHVGETNEVWLVADNLEGSATIAITDDWTHTCDPTNWEEHVQAPTLVVDGASHRLFLYAEPEIGVFLETNFTARAGADGLHYAGTTYKPCRHPDCRARVQMLVKKEEPVSAPDGVAGTIRTNGPVLPGAPARPEGVYLLAGEHELTYSAPFSLDCVADLCKGGAVTNVTWDVCKLSVTNTPYLGLDLTDAGKLTNATGFAEAVIEARPGNTTASYYWEFIDPVRGVIGGQDDAKGTAEIQTKFPPVPSMVFEGDYVRCAATLTETNPPDGHAPCTASATATNAITIVRVDVVMEGVDEEDEEKVGAMLYYIPDVADSEEHVWTEEGTNELKKIRFVCEPNDDQMTNHVVSISAPEDFLFEKTLDKYLPAKPTYTIGELNKKEFYVHAHRRSEKYQGDEIEAVHLLSGAKDKVKLTVFGRPLLVPDYDRNGNIDKEDEARSQDGKTVFRFWINNDDDTRSEDGWFFGWIGGKGHVNEKTLNVPESGPNQKSSEVSGYCDLEDFTPVMLSFKNDEIFPKGTPDALKESVRWKIKSSCVGIVWTKLGTGNANDFLKKEYDDFGTKLKDDSYSASIVRLAKQNSEVELKGVVLDHFKRSGFKGIFLMEGLGEGSDIVVEAEIVKNKKEKAVLTRGSFLMKIDYVEAMYRWMDLRECLGRDKAQLAHNNGLGEPPNGPDSDCNGLPRGSRHWVFVHGFNVNISEARGWASTMFKRLWQTGDNSRFTFANWAGDEGQFQSLTQGLASLDYYQNSENAFNSASNFCAQCTELNRDLSATNPAEDYLVGHSLGNVLISEAIQEYNLKYSRYYMVNAAVAKQAYNPEEVRDPLMINNRWRALKKDEYMASYWHALFDANDFRSTLHWTNRYWKVKNNYNVYSASDDRLKDAEINEDGTLLSSSVWVLQETMKGTFKAKAANFIDKINLQLSATAGVTCEGGWGVNEEEYPEYIGKGVLMKAKELTREQVVQKPLFLPFKNRDSKLNELRLFEKKENDDYQQRLRAALLSDAIPATTYAAGTGHLKGAAGNRDLEKMEGDLWPRKDEEWKHSDIKNISYINTMKFFKYLVDGK